jgi:exopolysaccharide biosynthesis protein
MNGKNGYFKINKYNCDIHTFELSKSKNDLKWTLGTKGKLETLTTLYKTIPNAICAINCGFFNYDASSENLFLWSPKSTTVVLTKDYKLLLLDAEKLTKEQMKQYELNSKLVFGASYTLVENGKVSIRHSDYSGDAYNKNPRSILAQLKDGSLMLVVVQGGGIKNKIKTFISNLLSPDANKSFGVGLTAKEQAQLMIELGAITAVNLDGGGSSEMVYNGKIMNKPTDGVERKLGSCLIVVKI